MEWQALKLGDICRIELGKTPSRSNKKLWDHNRETSNVWLSIADLPHSFNNTQYDSKEYISDEGAELCNIVPKGTLVVSFKLSLGRLAITGCDLYTNEAIAALYINSYAMVNQDYLYWYLTFFDWDQAAGSDIKVKGKTLNKAKLKEIEVLVPSIDEQKRIVAILDQVFADIEQARANTEQNLKNTRELFESYLQQVFSQQGDGWEKSTLCNVAVNLDNKRVPITKGDRVSGPYPYYGASGIVDYVDEYIFDEDLLLISEDGANLLARTYPIAFSASGKFWVNNHAHVLRFNNFSKQKFTEYYLNSIALDSYISGMAQPKLNQKSLNSIPIPKVSDKIAENVVTKLSKLELKVTSVEHIYKLKLQRLDELKKSILQKAFSGELTKADSTVAA